MSDLRVKKEKLALLVDTFRNNIASYKTANYKEARVRDDFIDKFFLLLDWDLYNEAGETEDFRDVLIEDNLEISGAQKAPDYAFRIGGNRVFFVEAKKPLINVKEAVDPAFQVRRYGYTAKLPVSILTDFEEFAVYDTRLKPHKNDKASYARLFYCRFEEFEQHFDFLYETFSKEAVRKGSIKKYIDGVGVKKGTSEVDKEFLKLIEEWRTALAKNLAVKNLKLDIDQLNLAVQKIIDRIIFLRIAEDKDIEQYETLLTIAKDKKVYATLVEYFGKANKKYNSELFRKDEQIDALKIDDEVLADIITSLYYPDCPYALAVLPIETLGNIYEQFLGKTIRLTDGHHAKIEEKPEVRKAGGVYYTPEYIVKYIVENTVGEMLRKAQHPDAIAKLTILDPACGSGSFLIGAYTYLLNYHLQWYTKKENLAKALKEGRLFQKDQKSYYLTIQEKQKILLNNIYGVDIDRQAVEVTKLSLMLKLLEGENHESAGQLFKQTDLKLLPTLSDNIKCGNSLIGSDFYADKNISLFEKEDMQKVNVFDWEKEFPAIFRSGGFDCVVGNPPWGGIIDDFLCFFACKYPETTKGFKDTYKLFIDKGRSLLSKDGLLGLITPNTYFFAPLFTDLRNMINQYKIKYLINLGERVFEGVTAPAAILIMQNTKASNNLINALDLCFSKVNEEKDALLKDNKYIIVNQGLFNKIPDTLFTFYYRELKESEITFDEFADIKDAGIQYHRSGIGMQNRGGNDLYERLFSDNTRMFAKTVPTYYGSLINRYYISEKTDEYFNLDYKEVLRKNEQVSFTKEFQGLNPKIIWRQTSSDIKAALDERGVWFRNTIQCCVIREKYKKYSYKYLLGIINSKFINYLYNNLVKEGGRVFPQVKIIKLKQLPIRIIDFTSKAEGVLYSKIIGFVEQIILLQKQYYSEKSETVQANLKQKIDIVDNQLDQLVYELYGLTEEEIRVVEESVK